MEKRLNEIQEKKRQDYIQKALDQKQRREKYHNDARKRLQEQEEKRKRELDDQRRKLEEFSIHFVNPNKLKGRLLEL